METFRSKSPFLLVLLSLACMSQPAQREASAAPAEVALIQKDRIEHVIPRRDYVGPMPTRLEWTAAEGADSYAITVENEIEITMMEQSEITTTSVPWPKESKLDPGTYFWRIVGLKGGRVIADSGRAAFVVRE